MSTPTIRHPSPADCLATARQRDGIGHEIHTVLGMLAVFSLPLSPAINNISMGILLGCALIRLWATLPCYRFLIRDRVLLLWLAWAVWLGITIFWSQDIEEGWTEFKAFRVIWLPFMLWPVLDRIPRLIGAFLLGVFVMNVIQLVQVAGLFGFGLEGDGRARAGLHPIQTGAMALAAVTWHMSWMFGQSIGKQLTERRVQMQLAAVIVGLVAAGFGIGASGSRGVWIATLLVLPIAWLVLAIRNRTSLKLNLVVAMGVAVVASSMWLIRPDYLQHRIESGWEETANAVNGEDYDSSTGLRVLFWKWGWDFFVDSPMVGQGAGSFRELAIETQEHAKLAEQWPDRAKRGSFTAAHPHSLYLHMLYATGLPGFLLALATLVALFVRTWRDRPDHAFAHGTFFVLIGWMIGTQFDCYHLNGSLFGLFALIVAVSLPIRPAIDQRYDAA